jgi:D-alanyl-D-alanine carboxypeptidase/D-alanyl-D-alanine-endopeptidase (penicillin-binding protein 4)
MNTRKSNEQGRTADRNFAARMRAGLILVATVIFTSSAFAQPTNFAASLAGLRAQLDAHANQPRFSGALWGVKVASLTTGKVLYEHHADRLMSPASNSKLYAAALALDTLGGDYQFATPIFATAKVGKSGTLRGDLIVSGRGDPSWKGTNFTEIFAPFIAIITNAGVRRITGDLVADTTFFHGPPSGGGWCVEDLEDSEGAEVSALTLADNTAQIRVVPGARISDACQITLSPPHTGIILINRTKTIPAGGKKTLEIRKPVGTKTIYVFGEMPVDASDEILDAPVPEPAAWFGTALKAALAQHGVAIKGKVRCLAWPEIPSWNVTNLVQLGEVKSPPLREILRAFLKPSQNLETDLVFDHTGELLRATNAPAWQTSEQSALVALGKFLATNGIPADVHFDEGSGLSRNNLTSADATVALLTVMATNRWASDFFNGLPVAGVDGTLRRRMKNTPAFQNVHAKTGTLRWVNALSGYVTTAAGEKLAFSLMLNRYDSPPDRRRTEELDHIAVLLAGFTGRSDE